MPTPTFSQWRNLSADPNVLLPAHSLRQRELAAWAAYITQQNPDGSTLANPAFIPDLPLRLPGLVVWHDASRLPAQADNSTLTSWPAVVGAATLTSVSGTPPLYRTGPNGVNGNPAVSFPVPGAMQPALAVTQPQPLTMVFVGVSTSAVGSRIMYDSKDQNVCTFGYLGAWFMQGGASTSVQSATPAFAATSYFSLALFNGSTSSFNINGTVATGNSGIPPNPQQYITLANNRVFSAQWQGFVCEVAMYNRLLSTLEQAQWRAYSTAKWGTP